MIPLGTFAQTITVRGQVVDSQYEPVPGATIVVVGTTKGVITDVDGRYSIEVQPTDQLQFSFWGCKLKQLMLTTGHVECYT